MSWSDASLLGGGGARGGDRHDRVRAQRRSGQWRTRVADELVELDGLLDVNEFSYKVAELDWSVPRLARNQSYRGWSVVIFKRHANELFDMTR